MSVCLYACLCKQCVCLFVRMSVCVLVMCFGARLFVRVSCMFVCPVSVCVLVFCFGVRVFVCVSMYTVYVCLYV